MRRFSLIALIGLGALGAGHPVAREPARTVAAALEAPEPLEPGAGDTLVEARSSWGLQEIDGEVSFAALPNRKSTTIGQLDDLGCNKALKKHKIPHVRAPGAPKIDQPIIITGPIEGVHFDTGRPYKQRAIATGDAIDCRLAISLVDLATVVKKHGITTVLVKSFHRPTQPILDPGAPLRHRIGFAIDIAGFKTKQGIVYNVEHDFHGKIGQVSCGPTAAKPNPDTKVARELWAIFCQVNATTAFDSGISPNYNASHFDHIHFDLTTDHPILFFP